MLTYKVIDGFIPPYHQDCIEQELSSVHWKYNRNISGISNDPQFDNDLSLSDYQAGFASNIFSTDAADNNDVLLGLCLPIIAKATAVIQEPVTLDRVRAGMFLNGSGLHTPHVDYYHDHYTVLYYANESDGDTYLFNQKAELQENHAPNYPSSFTLMEKVSPMRGRVVIFDGLYYHSSSLPQNANERLVININLIKDKR